MSSLVYLRNKTNGRVYVYINEKSGTKNGKATYKRKCIGHLDEKTGDIVPNAERGPSPTAEIKYTQTSKVIKGLSDRIGLTDALKIAFGNTWKEILTCAMYGLTGNTDLSSMENWSTRFETPARRVITQSDVLGLVEDISLDDIDVFQRVWRKKVKDREIFHLSSSPLTSYDPRTLSYIKDAGAMPNMYIDICYGVDTQLPIAFDILPGRVFSLEDIIYSEERYLWINPSNTEYILKEEYCEGNSVDVLVVSDRRFTIRMPSSHRISRKIIDEFRDEIITYPNYSHMGGSYNFIDSDVTTIAGKECFAHMYYSAEEAEREMSTFLGIIEGCRIELASDRRVEEHEELYERYFETNGPDGDIVVNAAEVMERTKYVGMTVIVSDTAVDPIRAMDCFSLDSFAERTFDNLQNTADHTKLKLFLRNNLISRCFIQFVTLILKSAIRKILIDNNLHRDYTAEEVVRELNNIATVRMSDRKNLMTSELNYRQSLFLDILGMDDA